MFLDPEKVIEELPLKENMIAVDFGCGSGGWTIPLAKRLKKGTVYGIDLLDEPISALKGKLKFEKVSNIKLIKENIEEGVSIGGDKVDLVLMSDFLFQVENRKKVIEEARRVLKKKGILLVVDWLPESVTGEKLSDLKQKDLKKEIENNNFSLLQEFQAGLSHFGLIYEKES